MSASEFLAPAAKQRVTQAIAVVEGQTAAEVVVTVRKVSGHYRHTDYLLGALLALGGLLYFLFSPEPFDEDLFPVAEVFFFVTGVALSAGIAPLRRLLTAPSLVERSVKMAAHSAFYELGVSRTSGRTGILVYVSLFERRVEVVTDIGVVADKLDVAWGESGRMMQAALVDGDVKCFAAALETMGPPLGRALPRSADDVNELSDEVRS